MDGSLAALGGVYVIVAIFLFVLAVLWFLLPFAIFGTKDKLDQLIQETKKSNRLLNQILQSLSTTEEAEPANVSARTESGVVLGKELMKRYDIKKEGDKYVFLNFRYDNLQDAIEYARRHFSQP